MIITKDDSIKEWALDEIRNGWDTNRVGIHLSDLLSPRKAYFQKVKPLPLTDDEIGYFTSGSAIEDKTLKLMGYLHGEVKEYKGILYTPDVFFNFPAEIKTRRRMLAEAGKEAEVYDHYLNQLRGYCALENKLQGWLIVLSLAEKQDNGKTKPEWAFYRVEFTQEELITCRNNLIYLHALLGNVLNEVTDYDVLFQCPAWMCGRVSRTIKENGKCLDCDKEFKLESALVKNHKEKGHKIKEFIYDFNFEKSCKWWDDCQPKL